MHMQIGIDVGRDVRGVNMIEGKIAGVGYVDLRHETGDERRQAVETWVGRHISYTMQQEVNK